MKRRRAPARTPAVSTPTAPDPMLQRAFDRVAEALSRMASAGGASVDTTHSRAIHVIETNAQMIRSGLDRAAGFERIAAVAIARLARQVAAEEAFRRPTPVTHAAASARAMEEIDDE